MIRYLFKNSETQSFGELKDYRKGAWVDVASPSEDEVKALCAKFKLDEGHIADALDPDEVPRIEKEGDLTYVFVRYPYAAPGGEFETSPLLFIVGPKQFITVAAGQARFLERFMRGGEQINVAQPDKTLLVIMEEVIDQYEQLINRISRQINTIRSRLKGQTISNKDFVNFVVVEDALNEFLSAMIPLAGVLRRTLRYSSSDVFASVSDDDVEDLILNNDQSIENCRSNIKSVVNIREAYSTINSNNLNQTMKMLTAVTVLITFPNVVFSMYGMNIGLPLSGEPWAFALLLAISLGLPLSLLVWARRRKLL